MVAALVWHTIRRVRHATSCVLDNPRFVPIELIDDNAWHDQDDLLVFQQTLQRRYQSLLFSIFGNIEPYAGIDKQVKKN